MKKAWSIIGIVLFSLVCLWYIFKATYVFAIFTVPTDANKPVIMPGDKIYVSRFVKPGLNKFIVFEKEGVPLSVFRCMGIPNDVMEIKMGILYRNGKPLNEPKVWNEYLIPKAILNNIKGFVANKGYDLYPVNDSTTRISLSANDQQDLKLSLPRYIVPKDSVNELVTKAYPNTKYNEDNFGPVKIPANSYFVLGDDRHNAADSRYLGFIKASEIKATVINK